MKAYVKDEIKALKENIQNLKDLVNKSFDEILFKILELLKFAKGILTGSGSDMEKDAVITNIQKLYLNIHYRRKEIKEIKG